MIFLEASLDTLFGVSQVVSRALDLRETLHEVLRVLDEGVGLASGMVSLADPTSGEITVTAAHGIEAGRADAVRYQRGEGIVGTIMERGRTVVLERVADEKCFLDRLGLYDPELPFIAVPVRVGGNLVGVLAAQPGLADDTLLDERARLPEVIANFIGQGVRLSWQIERARHDPTHEHDKRRGTVRGQFGFSNIVGHTALMQRVFDQVRQVAKWHTTVLIRGETGTGKELIAQAIHYNSPRAAGAFVKINCVALPETLLESELFGHEKGAFTGAVAQRKGRFEQADGGTLFLDEIGDVSAAFQAKLLRILQEGELERVGGSRTLKVDVRVIAATHRDLETYVEQGRFREDLYYRLNVMPIVIPPLRERIEDIPDVTRFLAAKIGKAQGRDLTITDSAMRVLLHHHWPGNVRELENYLERAAVMSESGVIDRDLVLLSGVEERVTPARTAATPPAQLDDPDLDDRERVIAALEQAGWVQAKAARLLGMTPRQIAYRIQTLNIKVRQI